MVVFLGSIFLETLKMHSQVKLSSKNLYTYLHCDYLTYFISNNTHAACCFYHIMLQSSKQRPTSGQTPSKNAGTDRPNVERCIQVDRPIFKKYVLKTLKHLYESGPRLYGEKLSRVEGSPSQPSQLYRAFVRQESLPRLTELTAGSFSSEFTQICIFLQAFNNRLHHSRRATQLRQFEPDSDFGSIFFLNYNARACSVNLHLAGAHRQDILSQLNTKCE